MADDVIRCGLDIEARQDELLRQLDELNGQVERALAALLGERQSAEALRAMVPASLRKMAHAA
jgi:hypothetical protein